MKYLAILIFSVILVSGCLPEEMIQDDTLLSHVVVTGQVLAPAAGASGGPSRAANRVLLHPVVDAEISVDGTDITAITDKEGKYLLLNVPKGHRYFHVKQKGQPNILTGINVAESLSGMNIVISERNAARGMAEALAHAVATGDENRLVSLFSADVKLMHQSGNVQGRDQVTDWLCQLSQGLADLEVVVIPASEYDESDKNLAMNWYMRGMAVDSDKAETGSYYSETGVLTLKYEQGQENQLRISELGFAGIRPPESSVGDYPVMYALIHRRWNGWRNRSRHDIAACYDAASNHFEQAVETALMSSTGMSDIDVVIDDESIRMNRENEATLTCRLTITYLDDYSSEVVQSSWEWNAIAIYTRGAWRIVPGYESMTSVSG